MKKLIVILSVVLVVLCAAAGFLFFRETYLVMGDEVYRRDLTELDLSGAPIEELSKLQELTKLSKLDIQNTGITEAEYLALQEALPECKILWSVPFQGAYYSLDTRQLSLSGLTEAEIPVLDYLTELETVDGTGCKDLDALLALQAHRPECKVLYQVSAGTAAYPQDATELTVPGISSSELAAAMAYLPQLQVVDASGSSDLEGLKALQSQYPHCSIHYTVSIGGNTYRENTAELTLENANAQEVAAALPYLPELTTVTFTGTAPNNADIYAMQQLRPDVTFIWNFDLLGVAVTSQDTLVDLSGIKLENVDTVEDSLKYFNCLERVIMCDCGISNEEMDALGQRNPDIRFVWTVSLGYYIRLRTDANYFMPYQFDTKVTDRDLVNLKYCIDLECLDLGHMDVKNTDFLAYMPKMKYLLLADTKVSDISGCANMPELIYAELFMTRVKDYSPLLNCKKLEDLNICFNYPNGIQDLQQMTWLKRLWLKGDGLKDAEEAQLKQALTNTTVMYGSGSATGEGWRESQNYYDMRDLLGMSYMTG